MNADEKTGAHADGLLMASDKAIVIRWFEIPAEAVFARGPEHEISGNLF